MNLFDKLRTQKLLSFTMILFTLSLGIVIGTLVNSGVKAAKAADGPAAPGASKLVIPDPVELSNTFTQIAKQVEPSVVNISTTYLPKAPIRAQAPSRRRGQVQPPDDEDQQGGGGDENGMNDFLYRFFGNNPFGGGGGSPEMPQRKGYALGSGVVVDKAGYILTNNHVVDKADRIQVKFAGDSTEYEAKVIGVDVPTDLAVIRIEGKSSLVPAKIGNSDAVQVGDWAVAIGSPFGFQATVTAGIISAKEREVDPQQQFQHFLQTDAAINPGNSGGPLLNIRGEVVGINTAIASRSGGYQGIGFALPINMAAQVYNEIIATGKVTRGSIGITFTADADQNRNLLRGIGKTGEGVFVTTVAPGGPADKAGLKEGDIITSINGKPVHDGGGLVGVVSTTKVGTPVNLGILRNGKQQSMPVTVGNLAQVFPDRYGSGTDEESAKPGATSVSFGISIQPMTDQKRNALGLKETAGIQIAEVESNSFAEDIGLRANDVITSINNQPITSVEDVKRVQTTLKPGDAVAFRVLRRAQAALANGQGRGGGDWATQYLAGTLPSNSR